MIDLKALFATFVTETHEQTAELERLLLKLEHAPHDTEVIDAVYRAAHTIKGSSGIVGLTDLCNFTHLVEEALEPVRSAITEATPSLISLLLACTDLIRQMVDEVGGGPAWDRTRIIILSQQLQGGEAKGECSPVPSGETGPAAAAGTASRRAATIRVEMAKLDRLVDSVGEMVIVQSMLCQALQELAGVESSVERLEGLAVQLHRVGRVIQEGVMSLRMLPVRNVFDRFSRVVRDLATETGKEVELVVAGEETELDKGVLEKIFDPLIHLIRNAIDHGIESPREREEFGKPPCGRLRLSATEAGGAVVIEVSDDGRGIDLRAIREKGVERGLVRAAEDLTDEQLVELIFSPGFSTASAVTGISGRGVGMDVVRRNIAELRGVVTVRSTRGSGSTVTIRLPLTLAIIDGLAVRVADQVFILPVTVVSESRRPAPDELKTVAAQGELLRVRGEYLPLLRLHKFAGAVEAADPRQSTAVVVDCGNRNAALLVDEVLGQQPVVMKNLGTWMPPVRGVSGGTILGDGSVALVLDVAALLDEVSR